MIEALPNSTIAAELAELGYVFTETGEDEHILPSTITERFCMGEGQPKLLTSGSTGPVAMTTTHAGIVPAKHYVFTLF